MVVALQPYVTQEMLVDKLGHRFPLKLPPKPPYSGIEVWLFLFRLTQPYVTHEMLVEKFGPDVAQEVAAKYFNPSHANRLQFKDQFSRCG